jgi:hypothetical protein
MSITRFILGILLAACITLTGCTYAYWHETFSSHTNPIPGWQMDFEREPRPAIEKDIQDYISKLPTEERKYVAYQEWFIDGKGQHAVRIMIGLNGTNWRHVLIYDKDDKRIRTVIYISGNSAS